MILERAGRLLGCAGRRITKLGLALVKVSYELRKLALPPVARAFYEQPHER